MTDYLNIPFISMVGVAMAYVFTYLVTHFQPIKKNEMIGIVLGLVCGILSIYLEVLRYLKGWQINVVVFK